MAIVSHDEMNQAINDAKAEVRKERKLSRGNQAWEKWWAQKSAEWFGGWNDFPGPAEAMAICKKAFEAGWNAAPKSRGPAKFIDARIVALIAEARERNHDDHDYDVNDPECVRCLAERAYEAI